ncbi:DUF1015 family protein [Amycolatopsis nigrescens]|uniref:DUF1015 family protein n=1 Tax=Amycolatopsis nigrescens TaxID=381445 RepID=UPI000475A6A8|nr:DUF1015 family protein [Amycolatopsis nigrescens]
MSGWIRPIRTGWVVRGEVPGPDVDEFAEPEPVIAALAVPGAADGTLLAVQHPHRTPAALAEGLGLRAALPIATAALDRLRAGHYRRVTDVVAPYRVDGPDGSALGVLCAVDPAAVGLDGLTKVRHTEEVYPAVVEERAAMLAGLGCATSAAMLVPVEGGESLTGLLEQVCAELGEAEVSTVDGNGREHRMWLLGKGKRRDAVLRALRARPLLVADGNHRVAAAATAERGTLLALVTGGPRLRIGPIHRVLTGTGLDAPELARRWRAVGLDVRPTVDREPPVVPGEVVVLAGAEAMRIRLPSVPVDRKPVIDHAVVEKLLVERALGIDPAGPSLRPLPGGWTPGPDRDAVLLLAPVPFADLLAVHAAGERMPRKATYFTPKPRSGLLLADL